MRYVGWPERFASEMEKFHDRHTLAATLVYYILQHDNYTSISISLLASLTYAHTLFLFVSDTHTYVLYPLLFLEDPHFSILHFTLNNKRKILKHPVVGCPKHFPPHTDPSQQALSRAGGQSQTLVNTGSSSSKAYDDWFLLVVTWQPSGSFQTLYPKQQKNPGSACFVAADKFLV